MAVGLAEKMAEAVSGSALLFIENWMIGLQASSCVIRGFNLYFYMFAFTAF